MVKSILITGANSGLGKDAARQLALLGDTEKIYLGCRNEAKAQAAKTELEQITGKSIFEIIIVDVSKPDSVRAAVAALPEAIDGLIMNAGGMGGSNPDAKTSDGVTNLFAANLLGHVVLFDELLQADKLTGVVIYSGSEAARGGSGMPQPNLETASVDEFASVADGSYFEDKSGGMAAYGMVKYMAALWMASEARKNPDLRLVTVSPGATSGTNVFDDLPLPAPLRAVFKAVGMPVLSLMGMMHDLPTGTKRYVDALTDPSYKTGLFYASRTSKTTGEMVDQAPILAELWNETYQDNANEAIHRFIN